MPKNKQIDDNTKEVCEEKSQADDSKKHDYYDDDSHGYEVYVDEEVEEVEADWIITDVTQK